MKILVLYCYRGQKSSYNHWCNADFYQHLLLFKNVEMKYYGRRVHELFPDHVVCNFEKSISLTQIREKFNFDVIIVAGRNRSFYLATEDRMWIPEDYYQTNCPKILIEPDYHKYRKNDWFNEMQFDVILHRHKSNVIRGIEDFPDKSHIWFPFSVDTSVFHPFNRYRKNNICFVGNSKSNSYFFRKIALEKLTKENLINFKGIQTEDDYITTLQQNTIYLNGASNFTIDCAKAFEIIASGGILFTNTCYNGFKELFKNYFVEYKGDFSDIISKAKDILNNPKKQKKIVAKGLKIVNQRHTHYQRCKYLLKIIDGIKFKPKVILPIKDDSIDLSSETNQQIQSDSHKPFTSLAKQFMQTIFDKPAPDNQQNPVDEKLTITAFTQIQLLLDNNIKICLLKNTCKKWVINKSLKFPLELGVENINKASNIVSKNVIYYPFPKKVKKINFYNYKIFVPLPVVSYLISLYGNKIKNEF